MPLQVQEQLRAVVIVPAAGVHLATAKPNDDRKMLDSHRALVFAGSACRALKDRRLRNGCPNNWCIARIAVFIQISPHPENDLLRIQLFAGVVGGTMFRTTPAFNTRINLQRRELRNVLSRVEPKVFITGERRDGAERTARQEDRHRAEHQMQMLRMRDQRQKSEQSACVNPPEDTAGGGGFWNPPHRHVGDHQHENQKSNDAGLVRQRLQPLWPDEKTAYEEAGDPNGHQRREPERKPPIKRSESSVAIEKRMSESRCHVIRRNQCKRTESPKHKRMRQTRQRAFFDHFCLAKHFPEEIPNPLPDWPNMEIG